MPHKSSQTSNCLHLLHTWEQSFHLQGDWVTVGASLVLHHQVIGSRILNVCLIDVKCCEITVFALILCNIINSESAYRELRWIMLRVSIVLIDFAFPFRAVYRRRRKVNVFLPMPAPASRRSEPHSQATCRGRGSAHTTSVSDADSPRLTATW